MDYCGSFAAKKAMIVLVTVGIGDVLRRGGYFEEASYCSCQRGPQQHRTATAPRPVPPRVLPNGVRHGSEDAGRLPVCALGRRTATRPSARRLRERSRVQARRTRFVLRRILWFTPRATSSLFRRAYPVVYRTERIPRLATKYTQRPNGFVARPRMQIHSMRPDVTTSSAGSSEFPPVAKDLSFAGADRQTIPVLSNHE